MVKTGKVLREKKAICSSRKSYWELVGKRQVGPRDHVPSRVRTQSREREAHQHPSKGEVPHPYSVYGIPRTSDVMLGSPWMALRRTV